MDKHQALDSHEAIPVRDAEEPYAGSPGQTRYERVHLVEADGSLRAIGVCRAINARTHPELKIRALSGRLHQLDDGRELALPFVYHDPDLRKFALVIPSALAHLELKECSKLMAEIAEDTRHGVPTYVRELTTVMGVAALARFIEGPAHADSPAEHRGRTSLPLQLEVSERENLLVQRERELAEQERALARMAEGLNSLEGALDQREEELDSARVKLEQRDTEQRERSMREWANREHERERTRQLGKRVGNWQEIGLAGASDSDATVVSDIPRRVAVESAMLDEDSMPAGTRSHPPPLPAAPTRVPRSGPPPLPPHRYPGTPPPLSARRVQDDARKTNTPRSTRPPPLPTHDALVTEATDPEPEIAAPPHFTAQHPGQMSLRLAEDELWLFAHLDEAHASACRHGAELMLQYTELEGYPVVVLSLVDRLPAGYVLRLALDGRAESDLRVLEHLSRSFRARVALYVEGLYIETVTVAVLREGVAQAMRDKLAKSSGERSPLGAAEAMFRALHAPPPLWNDDLPFGPARREAPSIVTVLASVEQLAAWLRPDKLIEATLTYSVPRHVIDATIRRVVRSAIAFGVALPDELLKLAVDHGAASDESSALREQLSSFRQRVEQKQNDLGGEATRKNWDRLLAAADERGLEVDESTHALARRVENEVPSVSGTPSERIFESVPAAELKLKLQEPSQRLDAIRELCVRGHVSALEQVLLVLDELPASDVAIAAAQLLAFGETAGDGLIEALDSPNEAVRQCAALALGRLQLRRALLPLLKQLEAEETPMYAEIARALGDFGSAALKSLVRVLPGATRPDRLVLALAHLANRGSARDVEKLENDPDSEVAQAARKAMARRSRMEWEDLAIREQRTLSDGSSATRLSQAFYAEASKIAT